MSTRYSAPAQNGPAPSPYPEVEEGIPDAHRIFHLGSEAMPPEKRERALKLTKSYLTTQKARFMGYQCNQALHYSHTLAGYLDMSTNNLGDPFTDGNFTVNTKFMERAVLDYFASLWKARTPHKADDPESYWGYVLSMGSTEGNINGMWTARDYLSGKKLLVNVPPAGARVGGAEPKLVYHQAPAPRNSPHAYTPVAFFSADTHYSITKAVVMLSIRTFSQVGNDLYKDQCPCPLPGTKSWPDEVPSDDTGAVSIHALAILVEFFAARGYPILVCFNYGTTFKGAYDDVEAAGNRLMPILTKYGLAERKVYYDPEDPTKFDVRTGYWFHVDGALGAAYMPFIEMAFNQKKNNMPHRGPNFDFRLPFVHSIAMSGHKWIGAPVPCGVYMTKVKYQLLPPSRPEYVGAADTTFAGSRNGLSAMLLWDYVSRHSFDDLINKATHLEDMAQYTYTRLSNINKNAWDVARTPLSLTVRFKRPKREIVTKYSLSNENLGGRKYSHVFLMEHVTKALVEELHLDLSVFPPENDATPFNTADIPKADIAPQTDYVVVMPYEGRGFHA